MIVSAIDGRIRMVQPSLKSIAKSDAVEKRLQGVPGITRARVNPKTGSLLVLYDHAAISGRAVRKQIAHQLKGAGIRSGIHALDRPPARRYVKYGLLGTITGSIGFLLFDSEQWHFRAGAAFLALLSIHLIQNRRRLLR